MDINSFIYKLKHLPKHSQSATTLSVQTNTILGKSLTIRGQTVDGEEESITSRGFRFGTSTTLGNNPFTASSGTTGIYTMNITGLTSGQTYYYAAQAVYGGDKGTTINGSLLSIANKATFKSSGQITIVELKEAFDSPQPNENVNYDFLAQVSGLNKDSNIAASDFYNQTPSLTAFFRGTDCSAQAETTTYHGGSGTVPTTNDYIFTSPNGGRVNFLPNGSYGFNQNNSEGGDVNRSFDVSNGKLINLAVCQARNCLTLDMPIIINNKLDIIENVNIGDIVNTLDGSSIVTVVNKKIREGYYILDNELKITKDHPLFIDTEWILPEEYQGKKEYIDESTEVIYIETEAGELLVPLTKNWIVSANY